MKRIFFPVLLLALGFLFFCHSYVRSHLPTNTYLSSQNLSRRSTGWLLSWLAKHKNPKLKIKIQERVYQFNYQSLGIILDLNATYNELVKETKLPFPQNLQTFYNSYQSSRTVMPQLIFTQDYYQKIENSKFDFTEIEDKILVDSKNKNLLYENHQEIFMIDAKSLEKEIISNFGKTIVLSPKIHRVLNSDTKIKVDTYNQKLSQVLSKPVSLYYENGQSSMLRGSLAVAELGQSDLHNLLQINYDQQTEQLSVGIDDRFLSVKIKDLSSQLNLEDQQFDRDNLKQNLTTLVSSRFNGYDSDFIYARLIEKPNTTGQEADKYIEIDISQQKMYLWDQGENISIHRVSSGLYYPTPPGRYKILNKANNAYSYIYHVWMPYWMAFSLDPKVNAYLGIHELPYWVDIDGEQIRRPRDFIGSPHTGGCVSLDIGEAQQVYAWAQIGTPVLIFD